MVITIIEFIILLIAHAAAGIYSSTLKYNKKKSYLIWGTWIVLQTVLLVYTEFVLTNWVLQFFTGFILSLVGQYTIFFATTKGKIAHRVFIMLTYSIFFCIVMTIFTMVKGSFGQLTPLFIVFVHAIMLFAMLTYFLRFVCPLCRDAAKNITSGWSPLIFVNIVFMITVILSSVFPVRLTTFSDPAVITFIFISVSIMAVYPVIFSSINNLSEVATKREVETQNKLLLAQIEAENIQLAADSQARHDRRHHNLVMLEFANNNDIESVRQYLKNLVESENVAIGEVRHCDNMTINTVLSVYERRAKRNDINIKISARANKELDIMPQDLVIVIANLFENAINGVEKAKSKDKTIDIYIKEKPQRLLIKMENTCKDNLDFEESLYGVGIRSVIATTTKYEGMYDFMSENGIFTAKISLNLN